MGLYSMIWFAIELVTNGKMNYPQLRYVMLLKSSYFVGKIAKECS